jgi:tRNA modification GTPase
MVLGEFRTHTGELLDQVLLVRFIAPSSYTGEDLLEIHCHGNPGILHDILITLTTQGARVAEPGEFTFRAFRNGRLSLLQAESVADLIESRSQWARRNALGVLAENGDQWVRELMDDLLSIWVPIEADLEFPTDDLDSLNLEIFILPVRNLLNKLENLRKHAVNFSKLQEGYRVVLAGSPNVGKSSLLNALLGYSRALVTEIPGTTRDTLEEYLQIEGIPIRLIDTAGLGVANSILDTCGMERSRDAIQTADLVCIVIDASRHTQPPQSLELSHFLSDDIDTLACPYLILANKVDLLPLSSAWFQDQRFIALSAVTGYGLSQLVTQIGHHLKAFVVGNLDERMMLNQRQAQTLQQAQTSLSHCLENLQTGAGHDLIATDLNEARLALEELSGKTIQPDLLGEIFGRFCIGK